MYKEYGKFYLLLMIFVLVLSWGYTIATGIDVSFKNVKVELVILVGLGVLSGTHALVSFKKEFFEGFNRFTGKPYKIKKDESPALFYLLILLLVLLAILFIGFSVWQLMYT